MKHIKLLFSAVILFLATNISFAQAKDWKEQKEFHKVMSQTFHPAEEGNYSPIKMRSAEMVAKAEAWKNAEIPTEIKDKKAVKNSLKQLVKGSKKLNKSLKKGASDEELKTQLFGLHDVFHTIVGLCNPKDDHEGHDH